MLLPEALPGIVAGLTITFVSLTGYSAMAGAIGGGGLGDLGIRYGYQRFLPEVMLAVVLVLIVFVQAVQSAGRLAGAPAPPQMNRSFSLTCSALDSSLSIHHKGNHHDKRTLLQAAALAAAIGSAVGHALAQDKPLKIGVTAGPHAQIMEQVKKVAEKDGLKLQIVEFSDYVQPNAALAAGDLDANSYQHKPYLDQQVKDRGYKFVPVGYTVNFPIGIYSKKVKTPEGPEGRRALRHPQRSDQRRPRACWCCRTQGLIKLKPDAGLKATPLDVTENPKKIKFVEARRRTAAAHAGRPGRLGHQHQLRAVGGPEPRQGRHRPGKRQEPVRQPAGGARAGQGQALGRRSW